MDKKCKECGKMGCKKHMKESAASKAMKKKMGKNGEANEKEDIKEWDKENSDDHVGVPIKKYTE